MNVSQKTKSYIIAALTILAVFIFLMCDTSYMMIRQRGVLKIACNLCAVLFLLILKRPKITLRSLLPLMAVATVPLLWCAFSHDLKQTAILLLAIGTGWAVAEALERADFQEIFLKIMSFLSVYSLITLFIFLVFPKAFSVFPIIENWDSIHYISRNAVFSIIVDTVIGIRNYGIFWEPGAFAVLLSIALWIELYAKEKLNLKRIVLYVVTIATTLSSLGIITAGILIFGLFFDKRVPKKAKIAIVVIVVGVFGTLPFFDYGLGLLKALFKKFIVIDASSAARISSVTVVGKLFFTSPIFGVGTIGFGDHLVREGLTTATFTFLNLLAKFGVVGALAPIAGTFAYFFKRKAKLIIKLLMVAFALAIFFSEAFEQIPIFYTLAFYGMKELPVKNIFKKKEAADEG